MSSSPATPSRRAGWSGPIRAIQASADSPWLSFSAGSVVAEDAAVVALLHDVIEDTDYKIPASALSGIQTNALLAITRQADRDPHSETYAEYIERVCADPVASVVKLADLWHNLSPERQDCLPAGEAKGLQGRYLKARDRIWKALGFEWWLEPNKERKR